MLTFVLVFPVVTMLIIGGSFGTKPDPGFDNTDPSHWYVASYLTVVIAAAGLIMLPVHLASYRERGVLRRFAAAGFPRWSFALAQLVMGLATIAVSGAVLLAVAAPVYGIPPLHDAWQVVAGLVLGAIGFVSIGVLLGTVLPSARAAQAVGLILFFPSFLLGAGGPAPARDGPGLAARGRGRCRSPGSPTPCAGRGSGSRPRPAPCSRSPRSPSSPRSWPCDGARSDPVRAMTRCGDDPAYDPQRARPDRSAATAHPPRAVGGPRRARRVPGRRTAAPRAVARGSLRSVQRSPSWRGAVTTLGPARGRLPGAVLAAAGVAVVGHGSASCVGWFGLCTLASWVAGTEAPADPGRVLGGVAGVLVVELTAIEHDSGWAAWIAGTTLSVGASVFARRQHILVTQLRDAQAGLAARAQAEERNRIARELHDVIAHSLTVSLLHVSSARLAVADAPEDAARSLAEAERLGRASLDEVRHAVGLLRDPRCARNPARRCRAAPTCPPCWPASAPPAPTCRHESPTAWTRCPAPSG